MMEENNQYNIDCNGYLLNSVLLPEEIISYFLSLLDAKTLLFSCRLVCKNWKTIIDDSVWKVKSRSNQRHSFSKLTYYEQIRLKLPWYVYFAIHNSDPFERNLLRNTCGEELNKYWVISPPPSYGWSIEPVPVYADKLPENEDFGNSTSCFSTSFMLCEAYQRICLQEWGINNKIMDELRPTITASEWFNGRYDCGCVYTVFVRLLGVDDSLLYTSEKYVRSREQWADPKWEKVSFSIVDYPPGVRYIDFVHSGKDTQFWAGNYGSKMAGGTVKVSLPGLPV